MFSRSKLRRQEGTHVSFESLKGKHAQQPLLPAQSHPHSKSVIFEYSHNGVRDSADVEASDEYARLSILDDRGSPAVSPADDCFPVCHSFEKDDAKAFFLTGHHKQRAVAILLTQRIGRQFSRKANVLRDAQLFGERFKPRNIVSAAHDSVVHRTLLITLSTPL